MSEFVKKNMVGYKPVPGGHSDSECTHVILTLQEYDQLLREKSMAEQEARAARDQAAIDVAAADQRASQAAYKADQEAQGRVDAIRAELEAERAENVHQRELNAGLLRINRERANADRKLKPKKERSGYIVLNSEEKEISFKAGSKRLRKARLWETTIQSPYSVKLSEAVVREQIERDLFPDNVVWPICRIGITGRFEGSYEGFLEKKEFEPEDPFYNGNVVITRLQRLKRKFRTKYWEVAFVHTKPLGDVPEDLLPFEKEPVQGT